MDMQPISISEEIQVTGLTSIHIQDSYPHNIASVPSSNPEPNKEPSYCNIFVCCLAWPLLRLVKAIWYILKTILKFYMYIGLFVGIQILFSIAGTLTFATFPFLLASLWVLRFSQFFKRGEDYDQVSQVKSVVEWFMAINTVILAFAIFLLCIYTDRIFKLTSHIKILRRSVFDWGNLICMNVLAVFGARFVVFWIIQNYMPRMTLEHKESGLKVIQAVSDIVDCLFLWYMGTVLMDSLPLEKIIGLPIRNWMEVIIFIIIGWNIIALSTHFVVWSIHKLVSRYLNHVHDKNERSHRYLLLERILSVQYLVYYGNGMKRSINFMLSSLLLLLVWVFYFGPSLINTDSKAKTVRDFGTWSCTVLLISSFFWILKDFVLLSWEANAVYNRLSTKISEARKSLYFLGILGRHKHDILKLRYEVLEKESGSNYETSRKNRAQIFMAKNLARVDSYYRDNRDEDDNDEMEEIERGNSPNRRQLKPKLSSKKRARVKHDLLLVKKDTMTLFDVQQMAQYFLVAANSLLKESYSSDILRKLDSQGAYRDNLKKLIIGTNNVSDEVQRSSECVPQDWEDFEELLDLNCSGDVNHNEVKTWLEKSHHNCLFLANTLCSAKEVVDCLNSIISVLLISASLIIWLLFTRIATTDLLILIASPFLAATFIFGDTCKSLFQGIMFVYVVHPFDVGDLCVIDEKMMEVKSIGVWKTAFSIVDKAAAHEDVIYPNTKLMQKTVINHKTEFDWNDSIEFSAEHLDELQIAKLLEQIEDYLREKKDKSMPDSHSVAVLPAGEGVKIVIRFRHYKHSGGMTYFQCIKEKDNRRSAIIDVLYPANNVKEENKWAGVPSARDTSAFVDAETGHANTSIDIEELNHVLEVHALHSSSSN
ncbi:mechanosensitive ion channel protein 9-like isoform X2 [Silene latifolia]|uniref:mechanosensitive ion channel protein 9-like isoform X2 n=2 Tax=Silene latifolia TaxID=37657 RepID=UPI003D7799E2